VSTCARCQALVASVVRLETADAAAADPAPSPWRAWRNWLVPLGAVATAGLALAVWLNVPAQQVRQANDGLQARVERAPDAPPATRAVPAPAEPAASAPAASAESARPTRPSADAARKTTMSSATPPVEPVIGGAVGAGTAAANAETAASAPPMAPPPAAPRARSAAAASADAAAPVATQQDALNGQALVAREAAGFDVLSPDAQVRWRVTGPAVTRSTDRGATWTPAVADATSRLLAGAAPTATVCWLVGERGLVLRTLDGVTFARVAAPVPDNLATVTATSAANAVVGTADGRRFVTYDGGVAWEPAR